MSVCGFNDKMLEGLAAFSEGLVEHGLIYRAEKNGESLDQAIRREISDMTRLLAETHKIDDSAKRILTEGIVRYAMGVYLVMRGEDIKRDYKEVVRKIGEYFHSMDAEYYGKLEGRADDMGELVKFLDGVKV